MKVGRNDPCPCGSGKKYKKCCLEEDERKIYDSFIESNYIPKPEEWEPEDEEMVVNEDFKENSEYIEDEESEEDPDEDDPDDETSNDEDDADTLDDEIDETKDFVSSEPDLPELSEEENKLVNEWWNEYKKMNDTEKERKHLEAFINQYPHLVDHLGLWHEVLFELGGDHLSKGIYEIFVELLLRIRKEFPVTYRASYTYYDSDLIYWYTAQGRLDEIDTFFDHFREDGKYNEKLDDLITFFHAIKRTDILLASLKGSKCQKYVLSIICHNIVSGYLDQPVTDDLLQTMANELTAEGLDAQMAHPDLWKERFLEYKRPFTPWDEKIPKKQSQAIKYYFKIMNNFSYFMFKNTNMSFNEAMFFSDILYDFYGRIVFNNRKRPADIFCFDAKNINDNTISYYNTWFSFFDMKCFMELNAFYYFAAYLKTCGNISEEKQHELQDMIAKMYQDTYEIAKNEGPEMLSFTKFPLWEMKE